MKKKILIVEDQAIIALTIQELLLDLGYDIIGVLAKGELVLPFLGENEVDLILMDIILAGNSDGIDTVININKKYDIPVIYLTASSNKEMFQRAKNTSPFGYITKPFTERDLYTALEIALHNYDNIKKRVSAEEKFKKIYANAPIGIVTIDNNGEIMLSNKSIEDSLGYEKNELIGENITKLFSQSANKEYHISNFYSHLEKIGYGKETETNKPILLKAKTGNVVPMEITINYHNDIDGQKYSIVLLRDIKDKVKAIEAIELLDEKNVLLKEINHRVKNNMQVVSSLISLQEDEIHDPYLTEVFKATKNRILSMSLVHEQLCQSTNFARISFKDYVLSLLENVNSSFMFSEHTKIYTDIDDFEIDMEKAIPCGLIINEIITNSFKHAVSKTENLRIRFALRHEGEKKVMTISDNGNGSEIKLKNNNSTSLGSALINSLVSQLNGELKLSKVGYEYQITF